MTRNGTKRAEPGDLFVPTTPAVALLQPLSALDRVFVGDSYDATIGYALAAELLEQQLAQIELERDDQPADVPEPGEG